MKITMTTTATLFAALLVSGAASAQTSGGRASTATNATISCATNFQGVTCSDFCAMAGGLWQASYGAFGGCSHLGARASVFIGLNQLAQSMRAQGDEPKACAIPSYHGVTCHDFCVDNGGTWHDNVGNYGGCSGLNFTNADYFGPTVLQSTSTR